MDLIRAATEAMRDDIRDDTVVMGSVVDHRVVGDGTGRHAQVLLGAIAYDIASGEPVSDAAERAESAPRPEGISDGALVIEAIQDATAKAVRAMQARERPTGTIVNAQSYHPLVNRGRKDGYTEGTRVVVVRGKRLIARAHVAFGPPMNHGRVGDRVRVTVAPLAGRKALRLWPQ